jgi:hypothetical protein
VGSLSPEEQAEVERLEKQLAALEDSLFLRGVASRPPTRKKRKPADAKAKRKAARAARKRNR